MVRGILADHISATSAAMGCFGLSSCGLGHGLYGRPACGNLAPRDWRLSVCAIVGKPSRRINGGAGERISWFRGISRIFRWPTCYHVGGPNLFKRASISLRMAAPWEMDRFLEGKRPIHRSRRGSPRNTALRVDLFCGTGTGVGTD